MKNHGVPPLPNGRTDKTTEAPINVLCVDDEAIFLASTKQLLEMVAPFHVDFASSVNDALEKMKGKAFDVVVSDYQMPEKSGLDFLKELRESGNDIPFILFTGKGREEVAVKALNLGADRYFNKFGNPETVYGELVHGIRQAVAQRRAEKEIWDREERLRAIFSSSPDGMFTSDLNGIITDCNLETLKLVEASSMSDIIGKHFQTFVAKEENEKVDAAFSEVLEKSFVTNRETKLLTKSGAEVPIGFSASILRDAYGKPVGAVALVRNISDRKKAEASLRQSENKFRGFFENSPDYCYIISPEGKIVDVSKTVLDSLGYSKDELLGKPLLSTIYAPSSRQKARNLFEKWKKTGKIRNEELEIVTKQGERRAVLLNAHSVHDIDGRLLYFVSVQKDITEHKKADEALRKSEEKYRGIVELSPDGIATMNLKGTVTSVNKAFLDLTGFSKDEIVGKHFTKLGTLRLQDIPKYTKLVYSMLRGKKPGPFEFDYLRKDGTQRLGEARIRVMKEKGKTTGLQAILADITERKKVEHELKESEEKYRRMVEQAPDSIMTFDLNGLITSCNDTAASMSGQSREELIGKHFSEFSTVDEAQLQRFRDLIPFVIERGAPEPFEVVRLDKDGNPVYGEVHLSLLKEGKEVTGFQTITRDVTERKGAEEKLRDSEKRFRELAELLPQVIFEYNLNGILTYVNNEAYTRFGFSKEEFDKGINIMKVIAPEYVDKAKMNVAKLLNGKKSLNNEYQIIRKDGTRFPAIISGAPIIKSDKVVGVRGVLIDITERKKNEEKHLESEKRFRELAELLPEVIFEYDRNGKLTYANHKAYRRFGFSKEEFDKGINIREFVVPEELDRTKKNMATLLNGEKSINIAHNLVTKNGTKFPAILSGTPIIKDEKVVGVRGILIDISEQQKTVQALATEKKRLKGIMENVDLMIAYFDTNFNFITVNSAYAKGSGYKVEELIGKNHFDLFPDAENQRIFEKVRDTGKQVSFVDKPFEYPNQPEKGTTYWDWTLTPIKNDAGKTDGLVLSLAETTQRMHMEQQLKDSEEKYHKQFEESLDAILLADPDTGIIIDCNRAATRLFGKRKSELVGNHQKILHPPQKLRSNFSRTFIAHREDKDGIALESEIVTKNGEIRDVIIKGNIIKLGKRKVVQGIFRDITEQKKAEEKLRDSEEKFRTISDSAQDSIILLDENGEIVYWNLAAEKTFGYTKEEAIGKELHSFITPERFYENYRKGLKKFKVTGQGSAVGKTLELFAKRKDGTEFPIELSLSALKIKGKWCATGIVRDITEQKKAETALRESEKRFRELSELLPEVIFETDKKGFLKYVNHAAFERFGYSHEEFEAGLHAHTMLVPEDRKRARETMAKVMKGEKTGSNEYTALRKDGTTFPIIVNSTPIIHGDKVMGIRGIMVDITERKKAEDALAKERKTLEKVTGNLQARLVMVSKDYRILWSNKYLTDALGDVTGKICYRALNRRDSVCSGCKVAEVIKTGKRAVHEQPINHPKHGQYLLSITSIPIKDEIGNVTEVLELAVDITERKKAEDALKDTLKEMETLNEKLSVIGKLTRHDARNKLSVIANNVYLAKNMLSKDTAALENLNSIASSIDQIEKILEFARNYEMLGTEELSYIDVKKSFDEAIMLLSCPNNIKPINDCEGLNVRADSSLRQIFYNLIDNSMKYGEKVSYIKVHSTERKDNLKLIYEDDGVGIPKAEKEKIFVEGYGKGTGYGLYLIRKICESYGWTIQETGVFGKGIQFTITIPKTNKNGETSYRLD
ncbi:MAG: hypothetical protein CW716_07955 [Candidatus Bathyarchaeum sp.]|nr:MAG: hypothetical protein CW716_07955 [Candidatus Bathyarchaeum sp.]